MDPRPQSPRFPLGRALSLGFAQALSLPTPTFLLALARALDAVSSVALGALFFEALQPGGRVVLRGIAGAWIVTALICTLARAVVMGVALEQGRARMLNGPSEPFGLALSLSARRSIVYAVLSALGELVVRAWVWLALISSGALFIDALIKKEHGFLSSLAFAIPLTVALPLLVATALLFEVAFARATARGESYSAAVYGSVSTLWTAPWRRLGVVFICGLLALSVRFALTMVVNGLVSGNPFEPTDMGLLFAGQLVLGITISCAAALFDHAKLQALLSLELHDLKPFEPEQPIPVANVIPTAPVIPVAPVLGPKFD